jgi:hypothetical protein
MDSTESTTYRITESLEAFLIEALDKHAQGEKIGWDITPPSINVAAPQLGLVLGVTFIMPLAEIGRFTVTATSMGLVGWDAAAVDKMVASALEQLRNQRTEELRAALAAAPPTQN